jgi:hypothetical protein
MASGEDVEIAQTAVFFRFLVVLLLVTPRALTSCFLHETSIVIQERSCCQSPAKYKLLLSALFWLPRSTQLQKERKT